MGLPNVALIFNTHKSYGRGILRGVKRWARLHRAWNIYTESEHGPLEARDLVGWKGDGVIGQLSLGVAEDFRERGLAVVSVSNRVRLDGFPAVFTDDIAVGRLAAEHFLERGFKQFAFVGYDGYIYSQQRRQGFADRLAEEGLRCANCEKLPIHEKYEMVQDVLDVFLKELPKPVAVLGANDMRAKQVTQGAYHLGLNVPEEVAVVGVDNDDLQVELAAVPLSSVELATETIGYNAAAVLAQLLAEDWVTPAPMLVPPIGVVMRESSDVMATRDEEVAQALRFIHDNAQRDLQVIEVFAQAGISRRVLEVRFKKAIKRTVQEEIWRAHVERAKGLLIETDLAMPEIAEMTGFPNASRLSAVFRRETSMTPTKYRRLYRQH